ncbi:MAG: ABC transporter ATP-binding protein [Lachnospiraceae bacterium]|nr:ABC transporter ATP-binding protein [Lachnospiraceae bacterium]
MIQVTNLTKKYGNHVAVDNLSFTVEKGQIYGFLGPNGAGKSTTMNIITGYLAATSGTVIINGKDIQKEPEEAKKCVGYLPELPPLYMDMTVEEYLRFVAELKKVPKADRASQVSEVMEMTRITDKKERLIKNLSKGYKQRVGFAQAILGFPEVIILDEPTVGLDPKQIIEVRDLIKKLGEEHTVILSSHILSEVSAVCDHIMIISHGQLVASDSPEGLQKIMSDSPRLEISVKGEKDKVQKVLGAVAGVQSVESDGVDEEGCEKYIVVADGDTDPREDVFYACADNRLPITGMKYNRKSLEDIFLELTGGEQAVEEALMENEGQSEEESQPEEKEEK